MPSLRLVTIGGLCLVVSSASGSVASSVSSIPTIPEGPTRGGARSAKQASLQEANDAFKENEDWWKDPWAMFDEEEGEAGKQLQGLGTEARSHEEDEEFVILTDAPAVPGPVIRPPEPLVQELEPVVVEPEAPAAAVDKKQQKQKPVKKKREKQKPKQPRRAGLFRKKEKKGFGGIRVVTAPVALLFSAVPKFRSLFSALPPMPVAQVLASALVVKAVIPTFSGKKTTQQILSVLNEQTEPEGSGGSPVSDDEEDSTENGTNSDESSSKSPGADTTDGSSGWWLLKARGPKLPPARELMDHVERLQGMVGTTKGEKEAMEREYEKASWQLQETQNEVANLQSTTRYLKAQLRDNQEIMDRAIRAERRKARDELQKMKEAMLQVMQRERQELRKKMVQQSAQVQAILSSQQQGKDME